jgi:hypothetical protein
VQDLSVCTIYVLLCCSVVLYSLRPRLMSAAQEYTCTGHSIWMCQFIWAGGSSSFLSSLVTNPIAGGKHLLGNYEQLRCAVLSSRRVVGPWPTF